MIIGRIPWFALNKRIGLRDRLLMEASARHPLASNRETILQRSWDLMVIFLDKMLMATYRQGAVEPRRTAILGKENSLQGAKLIH